MALFPFRRKRAEQRAARALLTPQEAALLASVRKRAQFLDSGFKALGVRFGWSSILETVPGAGDVVALVLSYVLVYKKACEADLPREIKNSLQSIMEIAFLIGFVPFIGDVVNTIRKPNCHMADVLERFMLERARTRAAAEDDVAKGETGRARDDVRSASAGAGAGTDAKAAPSDLPPRMGEKKSTVGPVPKNDMKKMKD